MGAKRIAVLLIKDRLEEGLRMAGGLTLMDDKVHVYLLARPLQRSPEIDGHLEMLQMVEAEIYSTAPAGRDVAQLTVEEVADRLVDYDVVIPF